MAAVAAYILRLDANRNSLFEATTGDDDSRVSLRGPRGRPMFAEPVPEFTHSRNLPLVCFVTNDTHHLTHIGQARRGQLAGTGLRRLNITEISAVEPPLPTHRIRDNVPRRFLSRLDAGFRTGGLLPPRTSSALIDAVSELSPLLRGQLEQFGSARAERVRRLSDTTRRALGEQREAIATALSIAEIDREALLDWDVYDGVPPSSFLDGLTQVRQREDSMIVNDLLTFPGHTLVRQMPHTATVFENEHSRLTVVVTNRQPLEKLLGTDLIYFNETFTSFIMVQYKAMEHQPSGNNVFRLPNPQLAAEIKRMNSTLTALGRCGSDASVDGFRLWESPFFLKLCPRLLFDPSNLGLTPGMYFPLEYWKLLAEHPNISGPKGGTTISYENARRYLDNTAFVMLAAGGWIGTTPPQSDMLKEVVRQTLQSGRAAVIGIRSGEMGRRRR